MPSARGSSSRSRTRTIGTRWRRSERERRGTSRGERPRERGLGSMGDRLAGKVAVVTGGGNGLGRATAVRFAEEGAAVVVADLLDGPGEDTVAEIEQLGGRAAFVSVDVTSRQDTDAMARTAIERFDGLHVVVTAAGVATAGYVSGDLELAEKTMKANYQPDLARGFVALDADDYQTVLDVNLTGTIKSLQS